MPALLAQRRCAALIIPSPQAHEQAARHYGPGLQHGDPDAVCQKLAGSSRTRGAAAYDNDLALITHARSQYVLSTSERANRKVE